jgi:hypothetical protein
MRAKPRINLAGSNFSRMHQQWKKLPLRQQQHEPLEYREDHLMCNEIFDIVTSQIIQEPIVKMQNIDFKHNS